MPVDDPVEDLDLRNLDVAAHEQQDLFNPRALQRQCSDASSSMDNEVILT